MQDTQLEGLDKKEEKKLRSLFDNRQRIFDKKTARITILSSCMLKKSQEINNQLENGELELVAPQSSLVSFHWIA